MENAHRGARTVLQRADILHTAILFFVYDILVSYVSQCFEALTST